MGKVQKFVCITSTIHSMYLITTYVTNCMHVHNIILASLIFDYVYVYTYYYTVHVAKHTLNFYVILYISERLATAIFGDTAPQPR